MAPKEWDLNARIKALYMPALDRSKLEAQDPGKRNITILNWAKCIRADGKSLFAIARVPFSRGSSGPERRKAANRKWAFQSQAVKDYFIACSAQVIGGNLHALREVLDLYGEVAWIGDGVQLPLPEEAMSNYRRKSKMTSAFTPVRDAQVPKLTTSKAVSKLPGVAPAGAKETTSRTERFSWVVPSMKAPSTERVTHMPVVQQHRYNLRSAGNPVTPSSSTQDSTTQQIRHSLRSGEKQKDIPQASLLIGTPCKSRPLEAAPVNQLIEQSNGNVQYAPDARLPLAPLLQPRVSRMAALLEHPSKPVAQQGFSLSSHAKQVESSPKPLLPHPSHDFLTGSQAIVPNQLPQPLRPAKGRQYDDFDKSISLAQRFEYFGMQPFNAEKLRSLQPAERDGYLSTWHKITSKVLAGLVFLPAYASFPRELKELETADEWRERLWREMTSLERDHFAQAMVERKQEGGGAASRLFQVIASELGQYIAFTAFYTGAAFTPAEIRYPRYESLDLETIIRDPSTDNLNTVNDCFDGEDQDLFNFHLFPLVCEGIDTVASDPVVAHLVDSLWQGLQWDESATWKEGSWWLKKKLKRNEPFALVGLLQCTPLGCSTSYHEMAQDLLIRWAKGEAKLGNEAPDGNTELPSITRSEEPSSGSLPSFPSAPEPSTSSTEEVTNLMGKVSILNPGDNLLQEKAECGLKASIWAH
ncbi:hypothetical protein CKM354_001277300 [Cercospora kikuchii]|uniref:Uncharacterized protein n=1 Tax=Cercospora kikuchii TaxID=84275 RepID=A0A9P3FMN1_9PEZI|nr:uncharacterized protein CKM354_001277300 [Cercospora kikuchii]GIZ49746.1 hypothetical protein CKM354_001277300 [Cercospora kikuchii]